MKTVFIVKLLGGCETSVCGFQSNSGPVGRANREGRQSRGELPGRAGCLPALPQLPSLRLPLPCPGGLRRISDPAPAGLWGSAMPALSMKCYDWHPIIAAL